MASDMAQKTHFATVCARSRRTTTAVLAKRWAGGAVPSMPAYFRRMPRTTRSAVRLTANVIKNSSTPVRNSTR